MAATQLDEYRARLRQRLADLANVSITNMGRVRFRPVGTTQVGEDTVPIPPSTVEEIAMLHTIYQAEAQILTHAITAVDEEYRAVMGEPKEKADPVKAANLENQAQERGRKGVY